MISNHFYDPIYQIVKYSQPVAVSLTEIKEASERDDEINRIKNGMNSNGWSEPVKQCQVFQSELYEVDGILLRGMRIIIQPI